MAPSMAAMWRSSSARFSMSKSRDRKVSAEPVQFFEAASNSTMESPSSASSSACSSSFPSTSASATPSSSPSSTPSCSPSPSPCSSTPPFPSPSPSPSIVPSHSTPASPSSPPPSSSPSPPLILTEERLRKALQEWKMMGASNSPPEFHCALSLDIMVDPVVIASGHTYERAYIERWFREGHLTCPKSNTPLANQELQPHSAMRNIIGEWCEAIGKVLPDKRELRTEVEKRGHKPLSLSKPSHHSASHLTSHPTSHEASQASQASPEASPEASHEASPEASHEASPEASHEASHEASPEASHEALLSGRTSSPSLSVAWPASGSLSVQESGRILTIPATPKPSTPKMRSKSSSMLAPTLSIPSPRGGGGGSFSMTSAGSTNTGGVLSPPRMSRGQMSPRDTALTRGLSFQEVKMRARSMEELRQLMSRSQSERRNSAAAAMAAVARLSEEEREGAGVEEGEDGERAGQGGGSAQKSMKVPRRLASFHTDQGECSVDDADILNCILALRCEQNCMDETDIRKDGKGQAESNVSSSDASCSRGTNRSGCYTSGGKCDDVNRCMETTAGSLSLDEVRKTTSSLWNMTKMSKTVRKKMVELKAVEAVVPLLASQDSAVQENAITVVLNLALEAEGKAVVLEIRALESILKVMHNGLSAKARENATGVVSSLSVAPNGRVSIREAGVIPSLVDVLASGPTPRAQRDSAIGLFNLALDPISATEMIEAGCVLRILDMLEEAELEREVEENSLVLLSHLVKVPEAREQLGRLAGVAALVGVLEAGSDRAKESAAACLLVLARGSETCREAIRGEGGICPLLPLSQHGSPRGREKATSLLSLLRSC